MSTTSQWWMRALSSGAGVFNFAATYTGISGGTNGAAGDTNEPAWQAPVSVAGNLLTLKVALGTAPGSGKSWRFQVSINGTPNTTLDVTVANGATTGTATGSVALSAGDKLTLKITPSGSPSNATTMWIATEFDPTTANHYTYPSSAVGSFTPAAPCYARGLGGHGNFQATDALANATRDVIPFPGTITDLYVWSYAAPGTSKSYDVIIMVNGSEVAATAINIAGSTQNASVTGLSVTVAAGDYITFKYKAANGGPASTTFGHAITLVPDTAGLFAIPFVETASLADTTQYLSEEGLDGGTASQSGTEATVQLHQAPSAMQLKALYVIVNNAAGSGKTRTIQQRINTANGNLVATIGNVVAGNDTSHIDTLAAGDILNYAYSATASTATSSGHAFAVAASTAPPRDTATAASTLPKLTSAATATQVEAGTGASALPRLASAAAGYLQPKAAAASALPKLAAAATATDVLGVLGPGASSIPRLTSSASGYLQPMAVAASALPKLSAGAGGQIQPRAVAASRLPKLRSSAAGVLVLVEFGPGPKRGMIQARPTIAYDGSALVNRLIPFGVDSDGGNLSLEHCTTSGSPYVIHHDGDTWYIQDDESIATYGLFEQRVYWTDIKSPYRNTEAQGRAGGTIDLTSQPSDGDTITVGGTTYTFRNTPTAPGDIRIGGDLADTRVRLQAALTGFDGLNGANPDVTASFGDGGQMIVRSHGAGTGGNAIVLAADGPGTTVSGSGTLEGGVYATLTANVLYARAVNELLKGRSEVLSIHMGIANGADCWALPGDRVKFKYRGVATTAEASFLGLTGGRTTWIDIDEWLLVTERHDRSDPSGVRMVDFVLAAPVLQYPLPPLPTWTEPISLPVPPDGATVGAESGFGGDGVGGYDPATWEDLPPEIPDETPDPPKATPKTTLPKTIAQIIKRNGLPVDQCCPDPTADIASGTGMLPPVSDVSSILRIYPYHVPVPAGDDEAPREGDYLIFWVASVYEGDVNVQELPDGHGSVTWDGSGLIADAYSLSDVTMVDSDIEGTTQIGGPTAFVLTESAGYLAKVDGSSPLIGVDNFADVSGVPSGDIAAYSPHTMTFTITWGVVGVTSRYFGTDEQTHTDEDVLAYANSLKAGYWALVGI